MHLESGTEVTFAKSGIVALAHLDASLATVVTCFRNDDTDKASGHRAKAPPRHVGGVSSKVLQSTHSLYNKFLLKCVVIHSWTSAL